MRICDLKNLRVGLLGFGREGHAMLDTLRRTGNDSLTHVFSDHAISVPMDTALYLGEDGSLALSKLDILIRSPGFPPNHPIRMAADAMGLLQTTSTNLFLAEIRDHELPVIGITGSKGKSTTSTLAHLVLEQAGVPSVLLGNIGRPALDYLDHIITNQLVTVMEMSSYQCSDLLDGYGPTIACLIDVFPEHLDWHGSINAYFDAKARIALTQRHGDTFLCNARSTFLFSDVTLKSSLKSINTPEGLHFADGWFSRGNERLFPDAEVLLPGLHNRENAVAALSVTESQGAKPDDLQAVLSTFRSLPFRLQDEGIHHGIRWVNDSLSTAPEAVAVALRALGSVVYTLIVGGYDRGYNPAPVIDAVMKSSVRILILIPDTGKVIAKYANNVVCDTDIIEVESLDGAVVLACKNTPIGKTCLFSPGAPSYNLYSSFEERGIHFRNLLSAHAE